MNLPDNELDLERRLARNERLFPEARQFAALEPPAELDRLVLAKARADLSSATDNEAHPGFFTLNQWALPVGLAATLVLSLTIFLRLPESSNVPVLTTSDIPAPTAAPRTAPSAETAADQASAAPIARQRREVARSTPREPIAAPPPAPVAAQLEAQLEASAAIAAADRIAMPASAAEGADAASGKTREIDPLSWYRRIVELRQAGKQTEADSEWSALQRQYPQFKPPP